MHMNLMAFVVASLPVATATRLHLCEFALCFRLADVPVLHQLAAYPGLAKAEFPLSVCISYLPTEFE